MGRHSAGQQPRRTTVANRVTQPLYPSAPHKKKATWLKCTLQVIAVIFALLIVMSLIGNFLPASHDNKGAPAPNPARPVAVADILRNNSPNWHVTAHIVAVVRPEDGGKSVTLVNDGHGVASGVITLPELGITATAVTVWNVWAGTMSPPTIHGLRVVMPPGTALYLILK